MDDTVDGTPALTFYLRLRSLRRLAEVLHDQARPQGGADRRSGLNPRRREHHDVRVRALHTDRDGRVVADEAAGEHEAVAARHRATRSAPVGSEP